jgi:hypothetical protein
VPGLSPGAPQRALPGVSGQVGEAPGA